MSKSESDFIEFKKWYKKNEPVLFELTKQHFDFSEQLESSAWAMWQLLKPAKRQSGRELYQSGYKDGYEKAMLDATDNLRQTMLCEEEQHLKDKAFRAMSFYRP